MKKSLASCLTSFALLSSMCFSSPLAQVHAEETPPSTVEAETPATSYTPIELNAQEVPIGYTHTLNIKSGDAINVDIPEDETFSLEAYPPTDKTERMPEVTKEFSVSEVQRLKLTGKESGKKYEIVLNTSDNENEEGSDEDPNEGSNSDSNHIYELKLANTSDYNASGIEIGNDTQHWDLSVSTPVTVTPIYGIKIGVTRADLKVGEGFDLNFSDKIRAILEEHFCTENLENLNGIFDYKIEEITYELTDGHTEGEDFEYIIKDDQDEWKGTISKKSKAGDKILFYASAGIKQLSEGPTEEEPREEIIDLDSRDNAELRFPVEFTIVDENDAEEENDGNIVFEVSPEYKKLTEKGETYKIETSVSLEDNADPDVKELFDAIVADKDSFKVLFKSANPEVATVSEEGVVTAVANGSTEIVAYIEGYEDELFGVSKVDVEIPTEVAETEEISDASDSSASSSYPKTGENFMAISAAILTLGIAVLAVVFMSKKKDTNEEK